jgi:YesN/AraC family two-component response regulator
LIVDDEPTARYGMQRALAGRAYELQSAENGREALVVIEAWNPDLVLCDIRMPEMDGIALLQEVNKKASAPLFILVTAHGSERIAVEAMKAGAYDYIVKPYELDELRLTIKKALDKRHLEQENAQLRRQLKYAGKFACSERAKPCTDAQPDRQGESNRCHDFAHRAERNRQGTGRRADSSFEFAAERTVYHHELCGHSQRSGGKRAVRP